jgi:hypothetical protein
MKIIITLILFIAYMSISTFAQQSDDVYGNVQKETSKGNDTTYSNGFKDGFNKYKGYRGIATGTLVTSILSPILGLAPAIGGSSGDPRVDFFTMPKDDKYKYGFLDGAKSRRNKKVWGNWALGSAISIGVTVAIIAIIKADTKNETGYQIPKF